MIVLGCFGMFEVAADAKILLYFIYIYIYNPLFLNLYIAYHMLTVILSLSKMIHKQTTWQKSMEEEEIVIPVGVRFKALA